MVHCWATKTFSHFATIDYGVLTAVTGRLAMRSGSPKLTSTLEELSQENGLTPHEILLQWAWDNLEGILVTSTSNAERAKSLTKLFSPEKTRLQTSIYDRLESAAKDDGFEGKQFYLHPHMEK